MKRLLTAALLVLCLGVVAACGADSDDDSSGGSGGGGGGDQAQSGATALNKPLECDQKQTVDQMLSYKVPKAKEDYKITLMEVSLAAYYFQAMAYGAQKAADEAGVELSIKSAEGYQSASQQVDQAQTVIAQQPDAIVLQPADIEASVGIVDQAKASDIPVVDISTELNSEDALVVMQDDYLQGKLAADTVAKAVPKGGSGIVQGGPENATWARKRVNGFTDQIEAKYPDIKISTVTHEGVDPAEGLEKFTDAAQAHPQIDWIYAVNTALLLPDAIPAQYKDVPYVGGGLEPMVIDALKKGSMYAAFPANQVAMGYYGVGTAIAELNGDDPPRVTCLPLEAVTKETVDSPYAQGELYPKGYKASSD